jgi:hypothetical protein
MVITPALVVINILLFVLVFLFLKTIDSRKWLVCCIALIVTPLAYFYVFYPLCGIFSSFHHEKKFNAENWLEKPGLRYEMIQFMDRENIMIGKTKAITEKELGKAEWLSWDTKNNRYNTNAWNYNLGKLPGAFTTTGKQLEVFFSNDTISKLRVKTIDLSKKENGNEE